HLHLTKLPPPLHEIKPEIPADISQIIMSALIKDPQQRPSAWEFAQKLAAAMGMEVPPLPTGNYTRERLMIGQQQPTSQNEAETMVFEKKRPAVLVERDF